MCNGVFAAWSSTYIIPILYVCTMANMVPIGGERKASENVHYKRREAVAARVAYLLLIVYL